MGIQRKPGPGTQGKLEKKVPESKFSLRNSKWVQRKELTKNPNQTENGKVNNFGRFR